MCGSLGENARLPAMLCSIDEEVQAAVVCAKQGNDVQLFCHWSGGKQAFWVSMHCLLGEDARLPAMLCSIDEEVEAAVVGAEQGNDVQHTHWAEAGQQTKRQNDSTQYQAPLPACTQTTQMVTQSKLR